MKVNLSKTIKVCPDKLSAIISTLNNLQEKQKELDEIIKNNTDVKLDCDVPNLQTFIWLNIELSELANNLEFFKYSKVNKGKSRELVADELADVITLLLSCSNYLNAKLNNFKILNSINDNFSFTHYKKDFIDIEDSYVNTTYLLMNFIKQNTNVLEIVSLFLSLIEIIYYVTESYNLDLELVYDVKYVTNKNRYLQKGGNY